MVCISCLIKLSKEIHKCLKRRNNRIHQKMQCKLHDTEIKMEALQEVFDKALQENADVLNEKKQLEETQKDAADSPRLWNKKGRIATSLQWREAQKHWSRGRETATRKKMQGYAVQRPSNGDKKYPFESVIQQSPVCKHRNSGGETTAGKISRRHAVFAWRTAEETCMRKTKKCEKKLMKSKKH